MKFSAVALAAFAGLAAADKATVKNQCDSTIYVRSYPYNGGEPGPLTAVKPGKSFSEEYRSSGSTIKVAKTKTLKDPLFFGYSFAEQPDGDYVYYEYSTQWGNPFADKKNTLSPGDGCEEFNCAANDASCYSTPSKKKVYGCPEPVNLVATICKN